MRPLPPRRREDVDYTTLHPDTALTFDLRPELAIDPPAPLSVFVALLFDVVPFTFCMLVLAAIPVSESVLLKFYLPLAIVSAALALGQHKGALFPFLTHNYIIAYFIFFISLLLAPKEAPGRIAWLYVVPLLVFLPSLMQLATRIEPSHAFWFFRWCLALFCAAAYSCWWERRLPHATTFLIVFLAVFGWLLVRFYCVWLAACPTVDSETSSRLDRLARGHWWTLPLANWRFLIELVLPIALAFCLLLLPAPTWRHWEFRLTTIVEQSRASGGHSIFVPLSAFAVCLFVSWLSCLAKSALLVAQALKLWITATLPSQALATARLKWLENVLVRRMILGTLVLFGTLWCTHHHFGLSPAVVLAHDLTDRAFNDFWRTALSCWCTGIALVFALLTLFVGIPLQYARTLVANDND